MSLTEADSFPATQAKGTLGTLFLVGRKTGLNVQGYPIDSERVTIGRDYDCDIRLYFSDVSKLHAEIIFDLLSGQAQLRVHGGNGVHYSALNEPPVVLKPPAMVSLSDKDSFVIRKKVFRFEYAVEEEPEVPASKSPAKSSMPFPSPAKPVRRRASHRLSLVPAGKQFLPRSPAKASRRNTLGAAAKGSGPTLGIQQAPVEEENEDVIDMVDGDEGDKVYLESGPAEASSVAAESDPFVSTQTSDTPKTVASSSPKARKSISFGSPLPQPVKGAATPVRPGLSRSQSTPAMAMPEVTAQLVRLTPKGSPSLRKSLLLRSARKAWEETRSPGVQGAVDHGQVAVRRKSAGASPKAPSPKTSPKEQLGETSSGAMSLDQEISAQQERQPLQEIQWIAEDGKANTSTSDSDSDLDSLEADISLDVPGQSVFSIHHDGPNHDGDESLEEEEPIEYDEEDDFQAENDENQDVSMEEEEPIEDDLHARLEVEEQDGAPEEEVEEIEDDVPDMAFALPGTPAAERAMSQYYTPQPRRAVERSQKSAATIGGPASRFFQSTGGSRTTIAPGSIGKPQRILSAVPAPPEPIPATPVQHAGNKQPMSERRIRQSHATPRALPAAPMSFKTPIKEAPTLSKATHPALNIMTGPSGDLGNISATPIGELRRKLGMLRQQGMASASRLERRGLTSSASLTFTPAARPTLANSISFTTVKSRPGAPTFRLTIPETPVAGAASGAAMSLLKTLSDAIPYDGQQQTLNDQDASDAGNDSGEVEDELEGEMPRSRSTSPSIPPSMSFSGLKEMLRPLAPPKTPNFSGMREMFAPSKIQATPQYSGIKTMMHPKAAPPTPAFDGIDMLLEEPELEAFEGEESMDEEFKQSAATSSRSRASTRGRKPATSRSARSARSVSAEQSSKPSRSRKPAKAKAIDIDAQPSELDDPPVSPAKSTHSTKSRSSAKSTKSDTKSKAGRGGKRKIETDSGTTVEIIKSSPPRPNSGTSTATEAPSPTKSKSSKSGRATKKEPLMGLDEQMEEVPSKPSRARKGKHVEMVADSQPSVPAKKATGKKVTIAVENKENEDEQEEIQLKAEKTRLRKARQSTVASRTRSRT